MPPAINLFLRAVAARGAPFDPYAVALSDPDVALDVIRSFADAEEPLVVRAEAEGRAFLHLPLAGDWLCRADGSPPARLPRPAWTSCENAQRWASMMPWLDAWEGCPDGSWLVKEAADAGVDPRWAAAAAAWCLWMPVHMMSRGVPRAGPQWRPGAGGAPPDPAEAARDLPSAIERINATPACREELLLSLRSLDVAVNMAARGDSHVGTACFWAVAHAAQACMLPGRRPDVRGAMADRVRRIVPTFEVLAALAQRRWASVV